MGEKLSDEQMELYRRVNEVLHYLWDPIGVADVPEATDEYYAYLPRVFSLLVRGAVESQIADLLIGIEVQTMGLPDSPAARERAKRIASLLLRHRDVIHERHSNT